MKAIAHLRIGARLTLGFALIIALLATIAGVGFAKLNVIAADIEVILYDRYANVALAQKVENEVNRQLSALRTALISVERSVVAAELAKVEDSKAVVRQAIEQLRTRVRAERDRAALRTLTEQQEAFHQREELLLQHIQAGRTDEARNALLTQILPLQATYLAAIEDFAETQAGGMEAYGAEALKAAHDAKLLSGLLAGIAVLMAVAVAFVLTRSITRPIAQALRVARTVAAGDLTSRIEVEGKDEMADLLTALRRMNDNLARIVSEVARAAIRSPAAHTRSPLVARIFPTAPKSRRPASSRPRPRWSRSPQPCDTARTPRAPPQGWRRRPAPSPAAAARPSPRWCPRWHPSARVRAASPTSPA